MLAPNTFKGTLSALEAAEAMAAGITAAISTAAVTLMPVGDGGEGTAVALARAMPGSDKRSRTVMGPLQEPVHASFYLLGEAKATAAVDMASASGLLPCRRPGEIRWFLRRSVSVI